MLRVLSRRVAQWTLGRETWSVSRLDGGRRSEVSVPAPKPPAHAQPEIFEWDFLLEQCETEEEKKEVLSLRGLYTDAELLNKKDFKTTVDWAEFEGKVPDEVLQKYKDYYAEAVRDGDDGKFDVPVDLADWDLKTAEVLKQVQSVVDNAKTRMAELDEEIKNTEGKLARLATTSIDEELALDPELAKEVDDAVSKELGYKP